MGDKKIHIKMGSEKLTKEEIGSHQNFDEIYKNYLSGKGKPVKVVKKVTWIKGMAFVTITAMFVVGAWKYASKTETHTAPTHTARVAVDTIKRKTEVKITASNTTSKVIAKKQFISPPIKGVDVPYKSYFVDAKKGGVLTYNKSKITIPSKAFCDEKGDDVSGKIDIKYREFHDPIDFFVSGIPMTYDSAGVQYVFESAGMLDMQGSQNGSQVYIKNGKNIKVAMASVQTGTKYNIYVLDTVVKNWTYIDNSKYKVLHQKKSSHELIQDTKSDELFKPDTTIAQIKKPVKPVKANENHYTLNIDADASKFPELTMYQHVIFEVDSTDKTFDPQWQRTSWREAKLEHSKNVNDYLLTVSNTSGKHDILVYPAFKGKNYTEAMKEYNLKYEQYKELIAKQEAEKKMLMDEYNKRMADLEEKRNTASERAQAETTVTQFLNLNKFGIWNCDKPCVRPNRVELLAYFTDERKDNLDGLKVYVVQKGSRSIFINYPGRPFVFDPLKENFAWLITQDNKLAVYGEEDFKQIKQKGGKYTFVMKLNDVEIDSYAEVQQILKPYM